MNNGLFLANVGEYADAELLVDWGVEAENAGWDGVFFADHLHYRNEIGFLDPWIILSGLATRTTSITLGSWITAVPRRLPWQLARELATLDHLSGGRVILGAGLGAPPEDYTDYGIEYDPVTLATRLDESLDVIDGLWSDGPFSYDGEVFTITDVDLRPKPVQSPRIPIVLGGRWPAKKPLQRGARWDGIMPIAPESPYQLSPEDLRGCVEYYHSVSTGAPGEIFVVYSGVGSRDEFVTDCSELGVTWILESVTPDSGSKAENVERIREGPPAPL